MEHRWPFATGFDTCTRTPWPYFSPIVVLVVAVVVHAKVEDKDDGTDVLVNKRYNFKESNLFSKPTLSASWCRVDRFCLRLVVLELMKLESTSQRDVGGKWQSNVE